MIDGETERVELHSGVVVALRRLPNSEALEMRREMFEVINGQAVERLENYRGPFTCWTYKTLVKLFADPRCSMKPGKDEIGPWNVGPRDVQSIVEWFLAGICEECTPGSVYLM